MRVSACACYSECSDAEEADLNGDNIAVYGARPLKEPTEVDAWARPDYTEVSADKLDALREKRGVTADTALRLAKFVNTTPEFWMNLQTAYDLYEAKRQFARAG